uniref:Orcokinin n=1 Tax=Panagrellus redivivus TaxID=6233 RepID=A0A7E4ZUL4_PANRE
MFLFLNKHLSCNKETPNHHLGPTRDQCAGLIMKMSTSVFAQMALMQILFAVIVSAYPAFLLLSPNDGLRAAPSKRAFDRLDMSPFDFGSLSKRYTDEVDNGFDNYGRAKKAFDRIDESNFGFGMSKRAFDRLDNTAFGFGNKRSDRSKRPFDRLESSNFGVFRKRASIADLVAADMQSQ